MIKIIITTKNSEYDNILFKGHAMYDDYGKDIVCAGVSSIFTTTVNAILKYDSDAIKYDLNKDVSFTVLKSDKVINLLIENMIELLKELEETYPKNILIREDEKDD